MYWSLQQLLRTRNFSSTEQTKIRADFRWGNAQLTLFRVISAAIGFSLIDLLSDSFTLIKILNSTYVAKLLVQATIAFLLLKITDILYLNLVLPKKLDNIIGG